MFSDRIVIDRLLARAVVGLNEWERRAKQDVLISIALFLDLGAIGRSDSVVDGVNYSTIVQQVLTYVEASDRHTVEALATDVAGICLTHSQVERARIRIAKPAADRFARSISAEIERTWEQLARPALIGLGSNVDAEHNLRAGAALLGRVGRIAALSAVYQTAGIADSANSNYLNAAAAVHTSLPAVELRRRLKAIETERGRSHAPDQPVTLDLDLCLLGDEVVNVPGLTLPNPEILERHYVARLLSEVDPTARHPTTGELLSDIASRLPAEPAPVLRSDINLAEPACS